MRIIVIDNGSHSLDHLLESLSSHDVALHRFAEFDILPNFQKTDADVVILSGGSEYPVVGNEIRYTKEIQLIQESPLPILGICLGGELIAHAFDSTLHHVPNRIRGPEILSVLHPEDPLFENDPPLQVFESHAWTIVKLGNELVGLARSTHGYEIIKHRSLPRYGFQFHPEAHTKTSGGIPLLTNALAVLTNSS